MLEASGTLGNEVPDTGADDVELGTASGDDCVTEFSGED